jgi:hypothetical protein
MEIDTRKDVEIDLSDEDFIRIAMMAHERDITFNKMVEFILQTEIDRRKDEKLQDQGSTDKP